MIILGPKTAILGPQFCRILVLGPHFWWSGGDLGPRGPPSGSAPEESFCHFKINPLTISVMFDCDTHGGPLHLVFGERGVWLCLLCFI